ncbi:AraC family transcriptional regulator [Acaryochloris sp. CCMEE 5410]|uniref:AraC family transcriptional regulator n=1 Tax=Acaryochloris sp. CCMEE 5410 TaxID=310037 RepID=UPI000248454A|nr:AraC family transcriptional regulator [Acaryochloris sp. CCMEE 5410]KAI9132943.1 helix-turn-helix transcriptional regulator [Acaryochloris sp. CCMEE 5410]
MSSSPDTLQRTLNAPIFASPGLGFVFEHCQQPRTQLPECANADHALCIVQSHPGQTRITVNHQQQRQVARPGEVWLLPAQQITQSQWDGNLDYFRLLICPQWLRELAHDETGVQQYALDLQLQVLDPLLFQIALALKTELTGSTQPDFLYVESLSHTLGRHLLRRYASCSPDLPLQYSKGEFQDAIAYIHDHLQDPIRLADLAKVVHMSPNYFAEQFKQAMGISPYRYVTQCRIQTAQRLLRNQHLAISEVAHQVGIANPSQFSRLFRQWTGISPRTYRANL